MATWYVSSLATGSGTGTLAQPWTPAQAQAGYVAGDTIIFLADGTYSESAGWSFPHTGSATARTLVTAANASGAVDGTQAVIQATAAITNMISAGGLYTKVQNFIFDANNTASTFGGDASGYSWWQNCVFKKSTSTSTLLGVAKVTDSVFLNNAAHAAQIRGANEVSRVAFYGCAGQAMFSCQIVTDVIIANHSANSGDVAAVYMNGNNNFLIDRLTIYSPGYNGVYVASGWGEIVNAVVTDCPAGATGFTGNQFTQLRNAAGYNPLGANQSGFGEVDGFQSLSARPYANAGAVIASWADAYAAYAPNSTAGGGPLLKANGSPANVDIGAVQSASGGSSGLPLWMQYSGRARVA